MDLIGLNNDTVTCDRNRENNDNISNGCITQNGGYYVCNGEINTGDINVSYDNYCIIDRNDINSVNKDDKNRNDDENNISGNDGNDDENNISGNYSHKNKDGDSDSDKSHLSLSQPFQEPYNLKTTEDKNQDSNNANEKCVNDCDDKNGCHDQRKAASIIDLLRFEGCTDDVPSHALDLHFVSIQMQVPYKILILLSTENS